MIGLFKEHERQSKLQEEEHRRKLDRALLEEFQTRDRKMHNNAVRQERTHRTDFLNTMQQIRSRECTNNIQLCEESLSRELGKKKQDAIREEKITQRLWENPELKELLNKMLVASVARDQAMQVAEKQALFELKREEEKSLAEAAAKEKQQFEEEQKRLEEAEFQAKLKYHRDLDELREFKLSKQDADAEQMERERRAIDEIKRQIQEESEEEELKRVKAKKELLRQALELQKVRDEMKQLEKLKEQAQDMKVDEYRKAQELRAIGLEEKKQLEFKQRLLLQEELLSILESIYAKKAKQEILWTELSIEEKDAAAKKRSEEEECKKNLLREELQRIYDMQLHVKKQKEDLQKKEDEVFRESLLAQLYEEGKLELMSQQKRRQKQLEHRRLAQKLLEENRKKKAMEKLREMADIKYHQEIESERLRMIENERMKYLRDHAKELLGYLPKGVFRDDQEIERLGEEFKKFYSRTSCSK